MPPALIIRDATPADVEAVRAIANETWWDTYPGLVSDDWITDHLAEWYEPSLVTEQIETARSADLGEFLIAELNGTPIAYLHFELMEDRGPYLRRLYVLPRHQRSGAGRTLTAELHNRLGPNLTYELDVHPENTKAVAFYKGLGAEFTGGRIPPCWDLMRVTT